MGLEFELEESTFSGYIPDGDRIPATVAAIRMKDAPWEDKDNPGHKAKRVEFKFVLQGTDSNGQDQTGTNLWGETPPKFNSHPDNKLRGWSSAILGREFPIGYRLDTDELVGEECMVGVALDEYDDKKASPDPSTGALPKKLRNRVSDVFPTGAKAAAMIGAGSSVSVDDEEPFVVDAGTWWPEIGLGTYPERLLR